MVNLERQIVAGDRYSNLCAESCFFEEFQAV